MVNNKNWKDIHPKFTGMLQQDWEDEGFTYEQVKEWIDIGLTPWDAEFCAWLSEEGYTALAVLNKEDTQKLKIEYKQSLIKKPLFDWYGEEGKITFQQFTLLSQDLGTKAGNNYNLAEINKLLANLPIPQANYRYTKIILVVVVLAGITYYLLKE